MKRAVWRVGAAAAALVAMGIVSPPMVSEADDIDSPITVQGTGEFASLRVTVGQTEDLINQIVPVTWSGAVPSPTAGFYVNYLQIMQCWGDDPAGPTREQCQFGGKVGADQRGGGQVVSRQLNYGALVDPLETVKPDPGSFMSVYAKFRKVTGEVLDGDQATNDAFDSNTTNEVPFGFTRTDGTGLEFFEMQTSVEAPGLGCGDPVPGPGGTIVGRSCWLVIVPRGHTEVDGSIRAESQANQLVSSPLSTSNWANRLVVPLHFLPVGASCPITSPQLPVMGQEMATEAILRWQPTLCAQRKVMFYLSQTSDDIARSQLLDDHPGLSLVTASLLDPPPDRKPVYAPILLSALTIVFNIDSQSPSNAPPEVKARNGIRIPDMSLNQRLVAKLLTQSYRTSVPGAPHLAANPQDLQHDPEFIALNPQYAGLAFSGGLSELLLPFGRSDIAVEVWLWVLGDPDARAFLDGTADPYGMKVNPNYLNLEQPADFPKADLYCKPATEQLPELCALDLHPYATDMHAGARAASRGDPLGKGDAQPNAIPPTYGRSQPQPSGARSLLAVADLPTAIRYDLPVAKLRNVSGAYVAPNAGSLLAGAGAMTTDPTSSTLLPNPYSSDPAAYPLTSITYAATVPQMLTKQEGKDYAGLIRYAAGTGQQPGIEIGHLPLGYLPLPESLRAKANATAKTIEDRSGAQPAPSPRPTPRTSPAPRPAAGNPPPAGPPDAAPSQSASPAPSPSPTPSSGPTTTPTAHQDTGIARHILLWVLGLGGLAAICGPALSRTQPLFEAADQAEEEKQKGE